MKSFEGNRYAASAAGQSLHWLVFVLTIFLSLSSESFSQALDTLTFGNSPSESAHSLNYSYSDTIASGGLGQTARRLLPQPRRDTYGAEMTFTMAVDPVQQNYFAST